MSIDLQEPFKRELNSEQLIKQKKSFLIVLHRFLLFYLALHNLIIPIILNSSTNNKILSDVHFWFLYQVLIHFFLMKKSADTTLRYLVVIGISGSLSRLLLESLYSADGVVSWGLFSIYISEISTFIFYFYYLAKMSPKTKTLQKKIYLIIGTLLAMGLQYLLLNWEVRGVLNLNKVYHWSIETKRDWSQYGCLGAEAHFSINKNEFPPASNTLKLESCGFSSLIQSITEDGLTIHNQSNKTVYISHYLAKIHAHKLKWVANKLYIIAQGQSESIPYSAFNGQGISLLKSNQQQELGISVLINPESIDQQHWGQYYVTPNSITLER